MVVENRAGAIGKLAAMGVKSAEADGFTLGMFNSTNAYAQAVMNDPGFDLEQDYTPIAHLTSMHIALISRPSFPAKTLPELMTYAKANPGKVSCGSIAPPLVSYLNAAAEMSLNIIPYRAYTEARYLDPPVALAKFHGMVSSEFALWRRLVSELKLQRV